MSKWFLTPSQPGRLYQDETFHINIENYFINCSKLVRGPTTKKKKEKKKK